MNVLIIGSGAREHAIAVALSRSQQFKQLFCYGTSLNPGINQLTQSYCVGDITQCNVILKIAQEWQIDLAIIGPEAPLAHGLADALWEMNIPTIGPKQQLAKIETSKTFARDLMQKHSLPGLPRYRSFENLSGIAEYIAELGEANYVVKANGLMSGKGVKVALDHLQSIDEAIEFCESILSQGHHVVVEEKLIGQEFSLMCFCDGTNLIPMPIVQDHKRAFVDDKGPNTGGMGSYSDANHSLPFLTTVDVNTAISINKAVIDALKKETQESYIGILYGSFIATRDGVYVIEFNARFGDPEALNVLTILESDLLAIFQAMIKGQLSQVPVQFSQQATVCKYAVPEGYPDNPIKNVAINIGAVKNKSYLYLAAVNAMEGKIFATGSRTAAYVGVSDSILNAEKIAEKEVSGIGGPLFHREDIGTAKLIQRRIDEMQRLRTQCD